MAKILKMKKTLLLLLGLSLLASNLSHAQKYDIEWGPVYSKDGGMFTFFYNMGCTEDYYYLMMKPLKKPTVLKYDYNHKLISTNEVNFESSTGKTMYPSSIIETSSGNYISAGYYDKKTKTSEAELFLFEEGDFDRIRKIEGAISYKDYKYVSSSLDNSAKSSDKGYMISENKKYLATGYAYSKESKKSPDHILVYVFDDQYEQIWSNDIALPYEEERFYIQEAMVTNTGEIFLTAKVYLDKSDREKGLPNYEFKIIHIDQNQMKETILDLGSDKAPLETNMFLSKSSSEIQIGGFYTDRVAKSGTNGVFFINLDFDDSDVKPFIYKFEDEFLEKMLSEKAIDKGKGVSTRFDIDHLITFEDGSFSFISENYWITTHTYTSNGQTYTYYVYHSGDIIIPRFSVKGELLSIEHIEKYYSSRSSWVVSYKYASYDNKIYLIYNDRKTKDEREEIDKGGKKARFTDLTVIGDDGMVVYQETLFSNKEIESEFVPRFTFQANDKLIISGLTAKGYQYGTMSLD